MGGSSSRAVENHVSEQYNSAQQRLYDNAISLLNQGEYQRALCLFESVRNNSSHFFLSIMANAQIEICRSNIIYKEAKNLLDQGEYSIALKKFESVQGFFETHVGNVPIKYNIEICRNNIVYEEAKKLLDQDNLDEKDCSYSIDLLDRINSSNIAIKTNVSKLKGFAFFRQAELAFVTGSYEETIKLLNEALKYNQCAKYYALKARVYHQKKMYTKAIECADKALEIDSSFLLAKEIKLDSIKYNGQIIKDAFGINEKTGLQDLNVKELFAGIEILEQFGYGDAQNRPISMFIGATRCGKSTTTNLFLGNPLIVKKDDDKSVPPPLRKIVLVEQKDSGGKFPVIGTKTTSETTVPMKYMLEDGGILWDCPGFGDSRGPQQEIINAWFVSRLFKTSPGVKLFNLCSAQSITDSANVAEFRGYVQQIIDLFGGEKLTGIKQTLVFTKSDKGVSAEEMKECLMYLIQEHFPGQKAIFDFFNNAKVMKIDKAIKEDIGKVLTKSDIPELNIAYEEMDYQPMKPHVGVDQGAQVFLYKSIGDLKTSTITSIKNIFKAECNYIVQNIKEKLLTVKSKIKHDIVKKLEIVVNQCEIELIDNNKSVKTKLHYFDNLSKFVATILNAHAEDMKSIKSGVDNFVMFIKNIIKHDIMSTVDEYLVRSSYKDNTFGEYAWNHPLLLGELDLKIDDYVD